jgi:hypothetical protein
VACTPQILPVSMTILANFAGSFADLPENVAVFTPRSVVYFRLGTRDERGFRRLSLLYLPISGVSVFSISSDRFI